MEELVATLKTEIIDVLNLSGMEPDDIDPEAPLFGDKGLGLDSIDALELIVLLEKNYGIKLDNPEQAKSIFSSVNNIARFIQSRKQ